MHKSIIKIFLILTLLFSQLQTVYAINLGRVIYDSETPKMAPADEPSWEEQLNGEDDDQINTFLNNEQNLSDFAANNNDPEPSADPAKSAPEQDKQTEENKTEEPAKVVTIVKHVYEDPPPADPQTSNADEETIQKDSTELQASTIRDTVRPIVDQLSTKVTDLETKVEATGTTLQNIILIVLVVMLCLLTLRSEVRFQRLADQYDRLKKKKHSNK